MYGLIRAFLWFLFFQNQEEEEEEEEEEETQDQYRPYWLPLCNHADLLHHVYHALHLWDHQERKENLK